MQIKKWTLRQQPLVPCGAIFIKEQKNQLRDWVTNATEEQLNSLKGVYTDQCFIVIGEEDSLPWWPGCTYLGCDDLASNLYIPTYVKSPYAIDLIQRAILNEYGEGVYAIELKHHWVIPLTNARPLNKEVVLGALS